jgi:hypothetical protein
MRAGARGRGKIRSSRIEVRVCWTLQGFAFAACLLAGGCATLRTDAQKKVGLPDRYDLPLDQLVVHSNFELPSHQRLLQELNSERIDICTKLGLPVSDEKIHVYLFKDSDQFYDFIRQKYPNFPDRRAFFVESDTKLAVYAFWGDRVAEDLRHEVCHGYLHSVVQGLPLWLDEGLAEYFEVPRGTHGVNPPHIEELSALAKQGWRPDIRRLEAFRSPAEMTETDYAESWAWMHWLLENDNAHQAVLQEYLAELRRSNNAQTPLSIYLRRLPGDPEAELLAYVQWLGAKK